LGVCLCSVSEPLVHSFELRQDPHKIHNETYDPHTRPTKKPTLTFCETRSRFDPEGILPSSPGIQYVLLLKIRPLGGSLGYELYHVVRPSQPGQRLPPPVAEGTIRQRTVGVQTAENIDFDARRIFAVPPHLPLPPNVNDPIVVDLRGVMNWVVGAMDPN
jgi:hypothetical protein